MDEKFKSIPSIEINSWTKITLFNLAKKILYTAPKPLILVDGLAGSGKTTLALKLTNVLKANLVHTDDISWFADPICWDEEIIDNIINPWLEGNNVAYRPSNWDERKRYGSIDVCPSKALIIEGMGASRKTLRKIATYSIWVHTEPKVARERVVKRDIANGENGATIESVTEFADHWDSLFIPFYLNERSWEFVDIIINGSSSNINANNLMVHTVL